MMIYAKIHSYTDGSGTAQQCIAGRADQPDGSWLPFDVADPTWLSIVNGSIVAATSAPPTPPRQLAIAAMSASVTLTCTGNSLLDAIYSIDGESQSDMEAEIVAFDTNGTFLDGQATIDWPDAGGALHNFDAARFKAFVTGTGAYVGLLKAIRRTDSLPAGMTTFPPAIVSIA